jgi:hypothetical protein
MIQSVYTYAGQASLFGTDPTTNTNRTSFTELAGYNIYYASAADCTRDITFGNVTSVTASNLAPWTCYDVATACDTHGLALCHTH